MQKPNNPLANAVMGFDAITAAEDTAEISPWKKFPQLKYMKQSSPSHATGMQDSVGIGKKTLPNLPRLPGVRWRIQRHINHLRRADNIFGRNAATETAVIRVAAIVTHHEIAIVRNFIRRVQLVGLAGPHGIRLSEPLTVDPHRSVMNIDTIARQPDHALHAIRRIRREGRFKNNYLLAFRIAP